MVGMEDLTESYLIKSRKSKARPKVTLLYSQLITYSFICKCNPRFIQEVQILTLGPFGMRAHWRFGYLRRSPAGLNFVARTELLYFPTTFDPFSQSGQTFAIEIDFRT